MGENILEQSDKLLVSELYKTPNISNTKIKVLSKIMKN